MTFSPDGKLLAIASGISTIQGERRGSWRGGWPRARPGQPRRCGQCVGFQPGQQAAHYRQPGQESADRGGGGWPQATDQSSERRDQSQMGGPPHSSAWPYPPSRTRPRAQRQCHPRVPSPINRGWP
ncbi:hypothetical protein [Nordella sp. HKS 07]|uniref:hypothetical protein n=1 Tax=Nordella sp. HKS 07 TaxID=2712222 RepID=UPI00352C0391